MGRFDVGKSTRASLDGQKSRLREGWDGGEDRSGKLLAIAKDGHTIIPYQSWGVDIRLGVISRCKPAEQIDKVKKSRYRYLSDEESEAGR